MPRLHTTRQVIAIALAVGIAGALTPLSGEAASKVVRFAGKKGRVVAVDKVGRLSVSVLNRPKVEIAGQPGVAVTNQPAVKVPDLAGVPSRKPRRPGRFVL